MGGTPPSSGVQHLHFGTSMPSGGVHPSEPLRFTQSPACENCYGFGLSGTMRLATCTCTVSLF